MQHPNPTLASATQAGTGTVGKSIPRRGHSGGIGYPLICKGGFYRRPELSSQISVVQLLADLEAESSTLWKENL